MIMIGWEAACLVRVLINQLIIYHLSAGVHSRTILLSNMHAWWVIYTMLAWWWCMMIDRLTWFTYWLIWRAYTHACMSVWYRYVVNGICSRLDRARSTDSERWLTRAHYYIQKVDTKIKGLPHPAYRPYRLLQTSRTTSHITYLHTHIISAGYLAK